MDVRTGQAKSSTKNTQELNKPLQSSVRKKSKRPQLSCNPCRARKIKCDRIQPCTACSLHQVANECVYDLSQSKRQPILQAKALREKDEEIAKLRLEITALGRLATKDEDAWSQNKPCERYKPALDAKARKIQGVFEQKRSCKEGAFNGAAYDGETPVSGAIRNLSRSHVQQTEPAVPDSPLCNPRMNLFSSTAPFPFGTFWEANEGVSALVKILPEANEILACYRFFCGRSQGSSIPILAAEHSQLDLNRILPNVEQYVEQQEEVLAFLFAILAQEVQHGLYDRCNRKWVPGAMEDNLKKGDIYAAAALQALRLASFANKPNLLIIQALVLVGSYLTDASRFLDSWDLFGVTVQLSRTLQLYQDPSTLDQDYASPEYNLRRALWWWMLQADQQYSITLSRPLTLSIIGDCRPPDVSCFPPLTQRVIDCYFRFNGIAREILSNPTPTTPKLNGYIEGMMSLLRTLPMEIRFRTEWLDTKFVTPPWPMDLQVASLHQQIHNYIIYLNQQRERNLSRQSSELSLTQSKASVDRQDPETHQRILVSCREVLRVMEYFSNRQNRGWINWSVFQQAYNAAVVLGTTVSEAEDKRLLLQTYQSFMEIHRLGIHRLAGSAAERLENILKAICADQVPLDSRLPSNGTALARNSSKPSAYKKGPLSALQRPQTHAKRSRRPGQNRYSKTESPALTSGKKTTLGGSVLNVKVSKASPSRLRKKQSIFLYNGNGNATSGTCDALSDVSSPGENPTWQPDSRSQSTNFFPICPVASSGQQQQQQQISSLASATEGYFLDRFCLNCQLSSASTEESQSLVPLASLPSQSCQPNYPSQPPFLLGHNYPSSVYTNSIPLSPDNYSASHLMYPMLNYENLDMEVDQLSYYSCQPQMPSLLFDAVSANEDLVYMMGNADATEQ